MITSKNERPPREEVVGDERERDSRAREPGRHPRPTGSEDCRETREETCEGAERALAEAPMAKKPSEATPSTPPTEDETNARENLAAFFLILMD